MSTETTIKDPIILNSTGKGIADALNSIAGKLDNSEAIENINTAKANALTDINTTITNAKTDIQTSTTTIQNMVDNIGNAISEHNTATDAHADIRELISTEATERKADTEQNKGDISALTTRMTTAETSISDMEKCGLSVREGRLCVTYNV